MSFLKIRSYSWITFSTIFNQVLNVAYVLILIKEITPSDFGIIALFNLFIGSIDIVLLLSFVSFSVHDNNNEHTSNTVFVSLVITLFFSIIILLAYYNINFINPVFNEIKKLLFYFIPILFVIPFKIIPYSKLLIKQNFTSIAKINLISTLTSFLVGILILWQWKNGLVSVWFKNCLLTLVSICLYVYKQKVSYNFNLISIKSIKSIFKYYYNQTLSDSIGYWSRKVDDLLIGNFINTYSLGLYNFAYNFLLIPQILIKGQVGQIALPSLSSAGKDTTKLNSLYLNLVDLLGFISYPLIMVIIVVSDYIPIVLNNPEWIGAVVIIKILAISLIFEITILPDTLFRAIGKPNINLKCTIITKFISISTLCVIIIYTKSIYQTSIGVLATSAINYFIFSYFTKKYGQVSQLKVGKINVQNIVTVIPMYVVFTILSNYLETSIFSFILEISIMFIVWVGILLIFRPNKIKVIKKFFVNSLSK